MFQAFIIAFTVFRIETIMSWKNINHLYICILTISAISELAIGVPLLKQVQNEPILLIGDGNEAELTEFPWQVSLRASLNNLHFCGGVILDRGTILTTASCADMVSPYMTSVVAGNINLNITSATQFQQIRQVASVHIHPNYAETTDHSNDIAVLKINAVFLVNEYVAPVPFLHRSYDIPSNYGIISGWGTKREEEISLQETLQKATVQLLHSNEECQRLVGSNVTIEDSIICITSPGSNDSHVDSCNGDQGGGIIFYDENQSPVLAGLVSFGIGCGRPNMPSFCTRVSPYMEFIEGYLESR